MTQQINHSKLTNSKFRRNYGKSIFIHQRAPQEYAGQGKAEYVLRPGKVER